VNSRAMKETIIEKRKEEIQWVFKNIAYKNTYII
jgi:hypothetical protein